MDIEDKLTKLYDFVLDLEMEPGSHTEEESVSTTEHTHSPSFIVGHVV